MPDPVKPETCLRQHPSVRSALARADAQCWPARRALFLERGFAATTMADVADAAGVSVKNVLQGVQEQGRPGQGGLRRGDRRRRRRSADGRTSDADQGRARNRTRDASMASTASTSPKSRHAMCRSSSSFSMPRRATLRQRGSGTCSRPSACAGWPCSPRASRRGSPARRDHGDRGTRRDLELQLGGALPAPGDRTRMVSGALRPMGRGGPHSSSASRRLGLTLLVLDARLDLVGRECVLHDHCRGGPPPSRDPNDHRQDRPNAAGCTSGIELRHVRGC